MKLRQIQKLTIITLVTIFSVGAFSSTKKGFSGKQIQMIRKNTEKMKASAMVMADFQMRIDAMSSDRYNDYSGLVEDFKDLKHEISGSKLDVADQGQLLDELTEKRRSIEVYIPRPLGTSFAGIDE